jgi:hypothetical protein
LTAPGQITKSTSKVLPKLFITTWPPNRLLAYDEQLRHYADMRIHHDLDDGVKINYGKFGDLLDSVKAVTGGAGDD